MGSVSNQDLFTRVEIFELLVGNVKECVQRDFTVFIKGCFYTYQSLKEGGKSFKGKLADLSLKEMGGVGKIIYLGGVGMLMPEKAIKLVETEFEGTSSGVLTKNITKRIFRAARKEAHMEAGWRQKVFSRALFGLAGLVACVTRVADFALGLVVAMLSPVFLLLGVEKVSFFVFNQFNVVRLFKDVSRSLRGMQYPQQFEISLKNQITEKKDGVDSSITSSSSEDSDDDDDVMLHSVSEESESSVDISEEDGEITVYSDDEADRKSVSPLPSTNGVNPFWQVEDLVGNEDSSENEDIGDIAIDT